MILAIVCLLLTALGVTAQKVNLLALGLAFWAAAALLATTAT
jgi:hypothetical protein